MEEELVIIKNVKKETELVAHDIDPQKAREDVVRAANDFKNSWRTLASALTIVWAGKMYINWGYENFDTYVEKEVRVRKNTAMKLIRSFQFLKQEEPELASYNEQEDEDNRCKMPTLEAVETLARAKKGLSEKEYEKVKNDIVAQQKDVSEVKKDLVSMMSRQREETGEVDRIKRNQMHVRQILATLRSLKRDIDVNKVLPGFIADDLDGIIGNIEKHFPK